MRRGILTKLTLFLVIAALTYQFGIKPVINGQLIKKEPVKRVEWANNKLQRETGVYDVIVAGESAEGISAAVSAARTGARVLLIAEGEDLGGSISRAMYFDLEINRDQNGKSLSGGILEELRSNLGEKFSIDNYKRVVSQMLAGQKNLDVVYSTSIDSPIMDKNTIVGINTIKSNKKVSYKGKRIIDATRDGKILIKCGVPYYAGSEDLNLKRCFQPVSLNFVLAGVSSENVKDIEQAAANGELGRILSKYKPEQINTRINHFKVGDQGNGRVLIQGVEVYNLDVTDKNALNSAYHAAFKEAQSFYGFLKTKVKQFENAVFERAADSFYIKEKLHFKGEQVLGVNDILENRDFSEKIAVASSPVHIAKLVKNARFFLMGSPQQYSIPLGCIIPVKVENILMVGNKISYSSLASSSAGTIGTAVTVGESAGVAAVYSITKGISPRDMLKKSGLDGIKECQGYIKQQGIKLPDFKIENKNTSNWSYSAVRQLNMLGLLSGGIKNDYRFEKPATQNDLAILLLNGIHRLSGSMFPADVYKTLLPYFNDAALTTGKAGEMLLTLNRKTFTPGKAYDSACKLGYINNMMALRLKDRNTLHMDEVYYLSAYNIMLYTGKDIQSQ